MSSHCLQHSSLDGHAVDSVVIPLLPTYAGSTNYTIPLHPHHHHGDLAPPNRLTHVNQVPMLLLSFSGGSGDYGSSSYIGNVSYSTNLLEENQQRFGYGSAISSSATEVIMHGNMIAEATEYDQRGHCHTNSEISMSSYASNVLQLIGVSSQ